MIERLDGAPAGIDAFRAVGTISRKDYDDVVVPLIETARRDGHDVRILCQVDRDFTGMTPGGAWEDVKVGLSALRHIAGSAVVSDLPWVRHATRVAAFFLPCPTRVFDEQDRAEAFAWLESLPERPSVTQHLVPGSGTVVVEVDGPLRSQDFDALALTVDTWLQSHAELSGLVLHARAFPGWENLAGLLEHLRFVRDHHRRIARIALAVDGALAALAPAAAGHFVQARIRHFAYEDLESAVAWVGGPG